MSAIGKWLVRLVCSGLSLFVAAGVALGANANPRPALWETLELSSRLYQEGMARKDAVLVYAAARLRLAELPAEAASDPSGWVSGGAMLRAAQSLASNDESVRTLITRSAEETPRGGINGPQVSSVLVPARGEVRLPYRFKSGLPAYVYAEGALNAPLALVVLEGPKPLCRTGVQAGRVLCRWVAEREGAVTAVVRNVSDAAMTILVVTN